MKRILVAVWRFLAGLERPSRRANADSLVIRQATVDDIPALTRLHVKTWNATYAPFLMKGPSEKIRETQWRQKFAKHDPTWFCFVVENRQGELVGFAQGNRSDHPDYAGELNKIYLLREYQGVGLGRRLIGVVAQRFLSEGVDSMWLFGDARNPSIKVWMALGAMKTDDDPVSGNYGWHDLRTLVKRTQGTPRCSSSASRR